jgi:DNA-binding IclR family transcriptional regulator
MTLLAASTGETAHLGVLDGAAARTIHVVDGWHTVRMHTWVGRRTPAHCSAMGKAVLATLPDDAVIEALAGQELVAPTDHSVATVDELLSELAIIRERGVAFDLEELELGLWCAAAPISDKHGAAVASVSVSAPKSRWASGDIGLVGEHVIWAATQITSAIGGHHPSSPWPPAAGIAPDPLPWIDPALATAHRLGLTQSAGG